jgi:hypothetical protein
VRSRNPVRLGIALLAISAISAALLYAPLVYAPPSLYGGGPNIGGGILMLVVGFPCFFAGLVLLVRAKVRQAVVAGVALLGVAGYFASGLVLRTLGEYLAR